MNFPSAILAAVGLIALAIALGVACCSAIQWAYELATGRRPAPHWMGVSDWAGPIFLATATVIVGLCLAAFGSGRHR